VNRAREVLNERSLSVSALAARTGLSRQAIHHMLRPDYDPIPQGFREMARALGVTPRDLLGDERGEVADARLLLADAAKGDARAFELLPAALLGLGQDGREELTPMDPHARQLAAAAGEIAWTAKAPDDDALRSWIDSLSATRSAGQAFVFGGAAPLTPQAVADTPDALRRHGVYGRFALADFLRHAR